MRRRDTSIVQPFKQTHSQPPSALVHQIFRDAVLLCNLFAALVANNVFVHDDAVLPITADVGEQAVHKLALFAGHQLRLEHSAVGERAQTVEPERVEFAADRRITTRESRVLSQWTGRGDRLGVADQTTG